jgi:hypothetical protein
VGEDHFGMFSVGLFTMLIMGFFWSVGVTQLSILGLLIFIFLLGVYSFMSAMALAFSNRKKGWRIEFARLQRSYLGKCIIFTYLLMFFMITL